MGVRGLARFCYQREAQTSLSYGRLADVTLAVDFVGFQFFVCEELAKEVDRQCSLPRALWLLLGGCPVRLERFVERWLGALAAANVQLLFVADAPQCFMGRDHAKHHEWQDRAQQKVDRMRVLATQLLEIDPTTGTCRLAQQGRPEVPRQYLQEIQGCFPFAREKIRQVLRRHGISVVTAPGEADAHLAELVRAGRAMAVVGNDSDFLCMRGVQYIPFSRLRCVEDKLITAQVFVPDLVAGALGIETPQLVDLALLCTNDATQQLDAEFQLAQLLNFPRPMGPARSAEEAITPELAAMWIRSQQTPVLDDPRVRALALRSSEFAVALHGVYEFYGYGAEFQQRYPVTPRAPSLTPERQQMFLTLLDRYDFSTSLIDVLQLQSRSLSHPLDVLALVRPSRALVHFMQPIRELLYHALDVRKVRETYYDPSAGRKREQELEIKPLPFMIEFLSKTSVLTRSQPEVEQVWRSLVFMLLFGEPSGIENAAFMWKILGRNFSSTKTFVAALLAMSACDQRYFDEKERILSPERLEILLLSSLVATAVKEGRCVQSYDYDANDFAVSWDVYASVGAFVQTLRVMHFVKIALGEKTTTAASCPNLFSAEVFLPVFSIVNATRSGAQGGNRSSNLTKIQVDSVLCYYVADLEEEERSRLWDRFCQVRAVMHRLLELASVGSSNCPSPQSRQPSGVPESGTQAPAPQGNGLSTALNIKNAGPSPQTKNTPKVRTPRSKVKTTGKMVSVEHVEAVNGMGMTPSSGFIPPLPPGPPPPLAPILPPGPPPPPAKSPGTKLNRKAKSFQPKEKSQSASPRRELYEKAKQKAQPRNSVSPRRELYEKAKQRAQQAHSGNPAQGAPGHTRQKVGGGQAVKTRPPIEDQPQRVGTTERSTAPKNSSGGSARVLMTPASVSRRNAPKQSTASISPEKGSVSSPQALSHSDATTTTPKPDASPTARKIQDKFQSLLQTLPVFKHREQILKNIASNQLTIIQGETGCGKSTSVPQFILDDWLRSAQTPHSRPPNIFVTQPRRIAAIELAKTVAKMRKANEFNEDGAVGGVIGYRIGQKCMASTKTKITYVTTGYMVERLIHDTETLSQMTHLIIDEVHERSMDVDSLLLLLKLQLAKNHHLRIVIMSATMDAKVLIKYFSDALPTRLIRKQPLFVGSKLFPVENVFLEDLARVYPQLAAVHRHDILRVFDQLKRVESLGGYSNGDVGLSVLQGVHECQLRMIPMLLQHAIVEHHNSKTQPQCILIFLPGIGSINKVYEELMGRLPNVWQGISIHTTVLHSTLELEQQQTAFQALSGKSTKIVLATNIAESSVTIPDVTHVINCGIEKQVQMPNAGSTHAEVLIDVWCSKASVMQRCGRAGRLMPGVAFHLFSEHFMESCMPDFTTPEILRKPLDRIVLQLKEKLNEFGVPSALLKQALDAPDLLHIDGAYKLLSLYDAIDSADENTAQITPFGSFVCHMPLNMTLCRFILTGRNLLSPFGAHIPAYMLANIVIVAAIIANPDLFVMPSWYHLKSAVKYMEEMKKNLKAKLFVDGGIWSEPLAMWNLYMKTITLHVQDVKPRLGDYLQSIGVSFRRYQALNMLISDLCERLVKLANQSSLNLDTASIRLLQRLDRFASSQVVDAELAAFATSEVDPSTDQLEVLRFLIIQNYSEQLIAGRLVDGGHYHEDADIAHIADRVDIGVSKEHASKFLSIPNTDRKAILAQLSSKPPESTDEFLSIAYTNNQISIYTKKLSDGDAQLLYSSGSFGAVIKRLSFPASLLYYIRDSRFPVDFGRVVEENEETFRFRVKDNSGSSLNWSKFRDNVRVNIGGRSLFGLPISDVNWAHASQPKRLLAVYADHLYTGDETRMFCSKCTLLPPNAVGYHAIVLLASARMGTNIWLQTDQATGDIVLVKVDQQVLDLPQGTALQASIIDKVNAIRAAFSASLQCISGDGKTIGVSMSAIYELCQDDAVISQVSKKDARNRTYEWRQVTMAQPTKTELARLRKARKSPPRYPPLE